MNRARFHFFELVRFSANVNDLADSNVPSVQQPDSLFSAGLSVDIGTLRSRMERIFMQDIAVSFHSCNAPAAVETFSRNSILLSRVLIDPGHLELATGVPIIYRDQVKFFRIDPKRIPELLHMT